MKAEVVIRIQEHRRSVFVNLNEVPGTYQVYQDKISPKILIIAIRVWLTSVPTEAITHPHAPNVRTSRVNFILRSMFHVRFSFVHVLSIRRAPSTARITTEYYGNAWQAFKSSSYLRQLVNRGKVHLHVWVHFAKGLQTAP